MITIDEKGMEEAQRLLKKFPKAVPKAAARAINRAVTAGKKAAWDKVKAEYTVKRASVTVAWEKTKQATAGNLQAEIISRGSPIALSKFKVKPKNPPKRRAKNPVFVQVKKSGGGTITDAFIAKMNSKHTGVFRRMQEGSKGAIHQYMAGGEPRPKKRGGGMTKGRAAINQKFGPAVPSMLGSPTVSAFIETRAKEVLDQRFMHEVNAILNGVTK